jgi:intraflagellar transport protein 140
LILQNLKKTSNWLAIYARNTDNIPFFVTDVEGNVFFADDLGHCSESANLKANVLLVRFHESRSLLMVLTDDLVLSHYLLNAEGKLTLDTAVR